MQRMKPPPWWFSQSLARGSSPASRLFVYHYYISSALSECIHEFTILLPIYHSFGYRLKAYSMWFIASPNLCMHALAGLPKALHGIEVSLLSHSRKTGTVLIAVLDAVFAKYLLSNRRLLTDLLTSQKIVLFSLTLKSNFCKLPTLKLPYAKSFHREFLRLPGSRLPRL